MSLPLESPAQQRLASDLLAWGEDRPVAPPGVAAELHRELQRGLAEHRDAVTAAASARRDGRLLLTRTTLERAVCDGWQLEPEPFEHTWENVRSHLVIAAIVEDWGRDREVAIEPVVADVWQQEASRQPGDPGSRSAWLNTCGEPERLQAEVVDLVATFREVWPRIPAEVLVSDLRRTHTRRLARGRVVLRGTTDVVLDSHRRDDRARALVVDLRTGLPRPDRDRRSARFSALLWALQTGRLPFRWASFHVPEGRVEVEDLDVERLRDVVADLVDAVAQLGRIADLQPGAADHELRLSGGPWCDHCRRQAGCPQAVG